MRYFVVDIETRIDKALLHQVFYPELATDEQAYLRMKQELDDGFFPTALHVPVALGVGSVDDAHALKSVEMLEGERGGSAGDGVDSCEAMVREFWRRTESLAESLDGCLVTFNGRRFDLPVLELQALRLGLSIPHHLQARAGRAQQEYHFDIHEFLTNRGAIRIAGGLNLLLKSLGLPGKTDIDGAQVQGLYEAGRLADIERYCRADVIQSYFLFLRVELMRGRLTPQGYRSAASAAGHFLAELRAPESRGARALMARLALIVIARNEERLLGGCLASARPICDELIVVDSHSTDRTAAIAREMGAVVIERPFEGYIAQKQFALEQVTAPWVLSLDADEQLTHALRQEIAARLQDEPACAGFAIRRILYHLDHYYTRAVYPDFHLRLFRRDSARFGGHEPHAKAIVPGAVIRMRAPMLHFSYEDIADHVATINRLTTQSARDGRPGPAVAFKMLANPAWRFCNFYVLRGGFREGGRGLYAAMAAAFYVFLKYAKLYERRLQEGRLP